ncbi:MAG TPA: ABC transporter substrate-binding protein [Anaerolineae bacterium]|nr:ABC transporter substrate-binding protein [Anaerolineae bacterium]
MFAKKSLWTIVSLLLVMAMVLPACAPPATPAPEATTPPPPEATVPPPAPTKEPTAVVYERSETLYTSGKQWGPPSNWNPVMTWAYATGTVGFCYETLFLYDPLADEFIPWLAESGSWTSDTVYEVKLREGISWTDGEALTAEDVVFTFELGKFPTVPYTTLWNWLESVEAVGDYGVKFTFSAPNYQEWAFLLYQNAIVPKHLWEGRTEEEVATGANENPVGTGPYLYETYSEDRMVWVRNDNWWAIDLLGKSVAPKYIVDVVNSSNNVALGLLLQGGLDLSNNFLPGVASLRDPGRGYGIETYFPEPPYMLSGNTAWLVLNLTKPPMDDPAFRKALAFAIDVDKIVNVVYGSIVKKASPTGLLPNWDKYVDQAVVDELGFSYDPVEAKAILAEAGYEDVDGDGFVEAPDGSKIELSIIVPNGWTDWMESIRVIAEGAQAVGINLTPDFPDYASLVDARSSGNFDMLINNDRQVSNTPWTYYDYVFRLPILESQTTTNFGRYENQEAWDLVQELDRTPVDDVEGMKAIISQLQEIHLTDLPIIPLWYNGMWAQWSSAVWTNWPGSGEDANHYTPATWNQYWNMTAILMLTELEPAGTE